MTERSVVNMSDHPRRRSPAGSAPENGAIDDAVVIPHARESQEGVYDQERDPAASAVPAQAGREAVSGTVVLRRRMELEPRGPQLPAWATRDGFRIALSNARLVTVAHLKYQAVHMPLYVVVYAPRGAGRAVRVWAGWVAGDHTHLIRQAKRELRAASARKDKHDHHKAISLYKEERRRHRWTALGLTLAGAGASAVGVLVLAAAGGPLTVAALSVVVVTAGALGGRPRRPAAGPLALSAGRTPLLGEDSIVAALLRAKVIVEAQREDTVLLEPTHKDGAGLACVVELPPGVSAKTMLTARTAIASALRVHAYQLMLERVHGDGAHEGVVRVWIGRSDPFARVYPSPLLEAKGRWDTWRYGVPFGVTGRGDLVAPSLVDLSLLIGGQPRRGKSVLITNILIACLLDPTIQVRLIDGKGGADYDLLAPVLDTFFKVDPARVLAMLQLMVDQMEADYEVLSQMGKRKLDEEVLASGRIRRQLIVIDEFRVFTTHPKFGKAITALLVDLASRGPALGYSLVLANQRTTVEVISGLLRGSVAARAAARTDNVASSNAVLGEGKAGAGWDASQIPGDKAHRGMIILDADGADPMLVKVFWIDEDKHLPRLAALAYQVREAAGVLPHQIRDAIEEALEALTGISSAAGGPTGRGRTSNLTAADFPDLGEEPGLEQEAPVLAVILTLAEDQGADWVSYAAIGAELAEADAESWSELVEDEPAFGRALRKALAAEMAAVGVAGQPPEPFRRRDGGTNPVRGYTVADLRTAFGLDETEPE